MNLLGVLSSALFLRFFGHLTNAPHISFVSTLQSELESPKYGLQKVRWMMVWDLRINFQTQDSFLFQPRKFSEVCP